MRDARWGRVMESTGEDPYLNCLFSRAMVEGFQGDDIKEPYRVAACVKHFAGYGAPTAGRGYNTVELSEHTLREFYLPSYRAGIDAGAAMVMTSFNTIDGVPATANRWLMRDILRGEMGFDGVVVTDSLQMQAMTDHYGSAEIAVRAVQAGVDVLLCPMRLDKAVDALLQAVEEGEISQERVDESVLRILRLKQRYGLLESVELAVMPEADT